MTLNITPEIIAAFEIHLNESVDCHVDGKPILRKDTYPYNLGVGLTIFASGYQAKKSTQVHKGTTNFCWLVELFCPNETGSLGYYHTGFTDLNGSSRTTKDPYQARRYSTSEEAQKVADSMLSIVGLWKVIEHGFHKPVETHVETVSPTVESVRADGMPTSKTERHLRRMLCVQRHGSRAYMDDGEASWGGGDNHRQIDYMRETPESIEQAFKEAGYKILSEQSKQVQSFVMGGPQVREQMLKKQLREYGEKSLNVVEPNQERYMLFHQDGIGNSYMVPDPDGNWTPVIGVTQPNQTQKLQVWFEAMPESNGKSNWTAILHKGDLVEGFQFARSEYKDRVRYDADCMKHLIGELPNKPDILLYDGDLIENVSSKK